MKGLRNSKIIKCLVIIFTAFTIFWLCILYYFPKDILASFETMGFSEIAWDCTNDGNCCDEISIDMVSIMSDQKEYLFILRITANELNTVILNNGVNGFPLKNYRFGSDTHGTLFDDREIVTVEYIYHDSSLENNQLYLIYSITSLNQNKLLGQFDIKLSDFGYYKIPSVNETTIDITPIYKKTWNIKIEMY